MDFSPKKILSKTRKATRSVSKTSLKSIIEKTDGITALIYSSKTG